MATIQETAQRICHAASVRLADADIIFSDTLQKFSDVLNMAGFQRFFERDTIEVVIIDPVYLCLPAEVNAANLFDMGHMLRNVSEVCQVAGCTLVLAHHLKKNVVNPYAPE